MKFNNLTMPVEGKSFDTASHSKHDPFAALNAKLDERKNREHQIATEPRQVERAPEVQTEVRQEVRPEVRQERESPAAPRVDPTPPRNPFSQPAAANRQLLLFRHQFSHNRALRHKGCGPIANGIYGRFKTSK
jgi:hypothetical protein